MTHVQINLQFCVVNDKSEDLMTAARQLFDIEDQIKAAKVQLQEALATRKSHLEGVLVHLV